LKGRRRKNSTSRTPQIMYKRKEETLPHPPESQDDGGGVEAFEPAPDLAERGSVARDGEEVPRGLVARDGEEDPLLK
jgi:hypothetical protein